MNDASLLSEVRPESHLTADYVSARLYESSGATFFLRTPRIWFLAEKAHGPGRGVVSPLASSQSFSPGGKSTKPRNHGPGASA